MFRRKAKTKVKEPKLSPEEAQKLIQNVTGQPQYAVQPQIPQQPIIQQQRPITQPQVQFIQKQPSSGKSTNYYITKKELIREKQTIVTQSNQVIETGQEITKQVSKELYQLTQDDLISIIQHVPENKSIHQLAIKMLIGNL